MVVVRAVDDRSNSTHGFPVTVSDERVDLAVLVGEGRLGPDQLDDTTWKRWREGWIRSVQQLRYLLEALQLHRIPAN